MLSELQKRKMRRFFHVLDFDKNGIIEEADFRAIAENLCILWRYDEDTLEYVRTMSQHSEAWNSFNHVINNEMSTATEDHFMLFADKAIVNCNELLFDEFNNSFTGEVFDNFDTNKDGHISLDEFIDLFVGYRIEVRYSAKAFRSLDRNNDGLITKDELLESVKEFFRSDDENSRGNWLFGNF